MKLRIYIAGLETTETRYNISTQIISTQIKEIDSYKTILKNKDTIILNKDNVITATDNMNTRLSKDLEKYKKKAKRLPYWIGSGFIGGLLVCQFVK